MKLNNNILKLNNIFKLNNNILKLNNIKNI